MLIDVSCIVCDSVHQTHLYKSNVDGSLADASDYFLSHRKKVAHGQIVSCKNCGFVYTSPQFTPIDYDLIYQKVPQNTNTLVAFQEAENIRFSRLAKLVQKYVKPGHY